MAKIVTFGELMIRPQPYHYERFVQADRLEFTFGGGEASPFMNSTLAIGLVFWTRVRIPPIGSFSGNVGKFQGCFCTSRSSLETRMITAFVDRIVFLFCLSVSIVQNSYFCWRPFVIRICGDFSLPHYPMDLPRSYASRSSGFPSASPGCVT